MKVSKASFFDEMDDEEGLDAVLKAEMQAKASTNFWSYGFTLTCDNFPNCACWPMAIWCDICGVNRMACMIKSYPWPCCCNDCDKSLRGQFLAVARVYADLDPIVDVRKYVTLQMLFHKILTEYLYETIDPWCAALA